MPQPGSKPRILLITRNLPPLVGGMERLMQQLALGISQYAELTVIGPNGCTSHLPDNATVHETSSRLGPFLVFSTWLAIKLCRSTRYDIVIGGSGLVAPILYLLSRLYRCKTVVFLHGLDLVIDNVVYQTIFVPCIRRASLAIANSHCTMRLAIARGVPESRVTVINPGTDLPVLPDDRAIANFREQYDIPFERILIFVGRLTRRKGLSGFIRSSLPAILARIPAAGLVVVGENPAHSLNKLGEQNEVLDAVACSGEKDRIIFLGHVNDGDLANCYAAADAQILPLIDIPGDIEGFGMVAVEAAACGTPTIAFDLGGVADAISANNGRLVPAGDYTLLADAVVETLQERQPDRQTCINHAANYAWPIFHTRVRAVLSEWLACPG